MLPDRSTLALFCMFPLTWLAGSIFSTFALASRGPRSLAAVLVYILWAWFMDPCPGRGGYELLWRWGITQKLRNAVWWHWARHYFPIQLHAKALPASEGPYIFVCHPHGIFGIALIFSMGSDSTGFSKVCPGLRVHLLGHTACFRIPLFRELCMMHGCGTVDRQTCEGLLRQGSSIALAPGGAKESLESIPGTMRLFLKSRRGFAKLALRTGASVVPVLSFGENDLYTTVQFDKGTWLRCLQDALQAKLGFAMPVFFGRLWMPLLPKRLPLHTVMGHCIRPPPEALGTEPSQAAIDEFHARYCDELRRLFEEHKAEMMPGSGKDVEIEFI